MMRHRILMSMLIIVMMATQACNEDPIPVQDLGDCSLIVISPETGAIVQAGDAVDIRWQSEFVTGRVNVELLKSGAWVATIAPNTVDDHYTYWPSDLQGTDPGSGFQIRVSSINQPDCTALSGEFSLFDTDNCSFELTLSDSAMFAGDELILSWDSFHTLGFVDLSLVTWEGVQGVIVSGTDDDGEFVWPVTSFHGGTNEYYQLVISDHTVESCADTTAFITIFDSEICRFSYSSPATDSVWEVGQTRSIEFTAENTSGRVSLLLFAGTVFLGVIDSNVAADVGAYEWTVHKFGFEGPDHMFRIGVRDLVDDYCLGRSEMFEILD